MNTISGLSKAVYRAEVKPVYNTSQKPVTQCKMCELTSYYLAFCDILYVYRVVTRNRKDFSSASTYIRNKYVCHILSCCIMEPWDALRTSLSGHEKPTLLSDVYIVLIQAIDTVCRWLWTPTSRPCPSTLSSPLSCLPLPRIPLPMPWASDCWPDLKSPSLPQNHQVHTYAPSMLLFDVLFYSALIAQWRFQRSRIGGVTVVEAPAQEGRNWLNNSGVTSSWVRLVD